jgi:hypothetical protein
MLQRVTIAEIKNLVDGTNKRLHAPEEITHERLMT